MKVVGQDVQVTLVLRPPGGDWRRQTMQPAEGGTWRTTVAFDASMAGTVHYFIEATDADGTDSTVTVGSASRPLSVRVF